MFIQGNPFSVLSFHGALLYNNMIHRDVQPIFTPKYFRKKSKLQKKYKAEGIQSPTTGKVSSITAHASLT